MTIIKYKLSRFCPVPVFSGFFRFLKYAMLFIGCAVFSDCVMAQQTERSKELVKTEDSFQKWKEQSENKFEQESNYSFKKNNAIQSENKKKRNKLDNLNEYTKYFGIGKAKNCTLLDCNSKNLNVIRKHFFNVHDLEGIKCIEYDFDDDGLLDFIVKIEQEHFCKKNLCQTYLFRKKRNYSYQIYEGPFIQGNTVAVAESKTEGVHDLVFHSDLLGRCLWRWPQGADQDFMCVMGVPLQSTKIQKSN